MTSTDLSPCPIALYLHCNRCLDEGKRPSISVGYTHDYQLQVWCEHHGVPLGPPFELKHPPDEVVCRCCNVPARKR
jgi:hypothetical protein